MASDRNKAVSRIELEETWKNGAQGVQRAIDAGALQTFMGPGGVEFCRKRELSWGQDQEVTRTAGISKAEPHP